MQKSSLLHGLAARLISIGYRMRKILAKFARVPHVCGMAIIGYARVSTDGQSLDSQNAALKAAGAARIYRETASGAKAERRELGRALKSMTAGDTLLVTRLDRLARSTRDLLNILDAVAKAGAGFRSLADIWADTTTPHGRLMLTVLGGLAEFERELIRTRTGEGRARAKTRGVHMGRPPKLTAHQKREALNALADGTASQADLARQMGLGATAFTRTPLSASIARDRR
jgi:DNA invertase Pin-like site-specific DNA recombinase